MTLAMSTWPSANAERDVMAAGGILQPSQADILSPMLVG
jgi:hypothetical protein